MEENLNLNSYEILEKLGSGSFGTVYRATRNDGYEFAIKLLNKNMYHKNFEKIMKETKILSSLSNNNIIKFIEAGVIKDQFYIVLELAKEGSLLNLIEKRKHEVFSDEEASLIMKNVLTAVNYIHQKDILHRDIKPANILINEINDFSTIKLSDFGISAMISDYSSKFFTQYCGTPLFMAPELFEHEMYSKPVDIWSCGIVTYWLLTGTHPYSFKSEKDLAVQVKSCEWTFTENFSNLAKDFFLKLACRNPEARYDACQALSHPWISRKFESRIPLTFAQKIHYFNKEQDFANLITAVFFCVALQKNCRKIAAESRNKQINSLKLSLKKLVSKSESEISPEILEKENPKIENNVKNFRIHINPFKHQNLEKEEESKSCFKSSNNINNIETLISPQKNSTKHKEFIIKSKKTDEKNFYITTKAFNASPKESYSAKIGPIDLSKNSNKNLYSNSKTQISSNSTSKNITPKYIWQEENQDGSKEKIKAVIHLNKRPPLGDFKSPTHKKKSKFGFPEGFFDLNKLRNKDKKNLKEIESNDNLDCSLEEMLNFDDENYLSQNFRKQDLSKDLQDFGSMNLLESSKKPNLNHQNNMKSSIFIGKRIGIHSPSSKIHQKN